MERTNFREFREMVRKELQPSSDRICIAEVGAAGSSVHFRGCDATLEVIWNSYTNELSLSVRSLQKPNLVFSVSELMRYWGHPDALGYRDYATSDWHALEFGIKRLADILDWLIQRGMLLRLEEFDGLAAQSQLSGRELEAEVKCEQTRARVNEAWNSRNYPAVVSELSSIEDYLTPVERKKLEFAKKQICA